MTTTGRERAVLVQVDVRDVRIYERLVERGYRLYGFPAQYAGLARAQGVPMEAVDFGAQPDPEIIRRAQTVAEVMVPRLLASLKDARFPQFIGVRDPRTRNIVRQTLARGIPSNVAEAIIALESFERLVKKVDLRLLLLRDDVPHPSKLLALACRQHRIRSLHLMHGSPAHVFMNDRINTDVVAVYGPRARDWFVQHGNAAQRVVVTGNSAWDGYRETAMLADPRSIKRSLGFDPDAPVVMYAGTSTGGNDAADYIYENWPQQFFHAAARALAEVQKRVPFQVIIKLHPTDTSNEGVEQHRKLARDAGLDRYLLLGGRADPRHIYALDLMVCPQSNVGIEALLLDRPLISMHIGDLFEPALFRSGEDGVLVVDQIDDLPGAIELALHDERTRSELARRRVHSQYQFNYLNDNQAFGRVLQLIDSLLDPQEAARQLEQGAPAPLTSSPTPAERASIGAQHLRQAQVELERGRLDAAQYLVERGAPYLDNQGRADFLRGYVAYQQGRLEEALQAFGHAVAAEPSNPEFYNGLGGALSGLGRHAEAEAAVRQALALDPQRADTLYNLGEILLAQRRWQEAQAALEQAHAAAPGDEQVASLLAQARLQSGA